MSVIKSAKPCDKCGFNRWKTRIKGKEYICRHCGATRVLTPTPHTKEEE